MTFALITGGGTGGHVYPGLALAEALVARGHPRESIHWVGSAGKLEETAVPAAGFTIDVLPGRGLQRRLTVENVEVLVMSARAFRMARGIVRRTRPEVVVGVGGYASLPCLVVARLRRIPTVVHEQNAAPGLANRIAVRLGARAAVSLPGTPLPGAVVTGNPVRAAVVAVERRPSAAGPSCSTRPPPSCTPCGGAGPTCATTTSAVPPATPRPKRPWRPDAGLTTPSTTNCSATRTACQSSTPPPPSPSAGPVRPRSP